MNVVSPQQVQARIVANRRLTPEVFELTLRLPSGWGPARPGQFVQLDCPPRGVFNLRRPYSLAGFSEKELGVEVEIVYGTQGRRSTALSECRPGEVLSLIGPLGRPFTPFPGRHPVLLGGGRGIAPIRMLVQAWKGDYPYGTILQGARTSAALIPLADPPYTVHLATDDGTAGFAGSVVQLLDLLVRRGEVREGETALFACGPNVMLAALAAWAEGRDFPCQVSLETFFGCGMGLCAGCAVPVRPREGEPADAFDRYLLACLDGPVVEASRIEWPGVSG